VHDDHPPVFDAPASTFTVTYGSAARYAVPAGSTSSDVLIVATGRDVPGRYSTTSPLSSCVAAFGTKSVPSARAVKKS